MIDDAEAANFRHRGADFATHALEIHRRHRGRYVRHGAGQAEPQIQAVQILTGGNFDLCCVTAVSVTAEQEAQLVEHAEVGMAIHQLRTRDAARLGHHVLVQRARGARDQVARFA